MRFYENIFIVRQELSPSQVQTLSDNYSKLITDHGGEVTKTEYCGLRHLAYPIKKNSMGHYILMNLKAQPSIILELERKMRLSEDVIRFLTVNVETLDPNPSALMQQSRQRESYGDRGPSKGRPPREEEEVESLIEEEEGEE